jgi:hypothetical protein
LRTWGATGSAYSSPSVVFLRQREMMRLSLPRYLPGCRPPASRLLPLDDTGYSHSRRSAARLEGECQTSEGRDKCAGATIALRTYLPAMFATGRIAHDDLIIRCSNGIWNPGKPCYGKRLCSWFGILLCRAGRSRNIYLMLILGGRCARVEGNWIACFVLHEPVHGGQAVCDVSQRRPFQPPYKGLLRVDFPLSGNGNSRPFAVIALYSAANRQSALPSL